MPEKTFSLKNPQEEDWAAVARLVTNSIPNYIVTQIGPRFCSVYLQHIAGHPGAYHLGAYDRSGKLAGYILGAMNSKAARRLTPLTVARLLAAANVRMLSPEFIGWTVRGLSSAEWQKRERRRHQPEAELLIIAVAPECKGKGLARVLLGSLEGFFRQQSLETPFMILTEKDNAASNRFYEKIGARLVRTNRHHGREINEWHKQLTQG